MVYVSQFSVCVLVAIMMLVIIVMIAETKPVAMESNPAYGVVVRQDTITATNVGSVAMQSNPAYGVMTRGKTTQSESEASYQ